MSCPDHELLAAFADGELEASQVPEIERHLSGCASCREFVDEMHWLDAAGRAALQAISVAAPPERVPVPEAPVWPWRLRPFALAAAAIVVVGLVVAGWFVVDRVRKSRPASAPIEVASTAPTADRFNTAETVEQIDGHEPATSGEAFERWAAPYRRLRIPLVPLEEVANYRPPEVLPIVPETAKPRNKN